MHGTLLLIHMTCLENYNYAYAQADEEREDGKSVKIVFTCISYLV